LARHVETTVSVLEGTILESVGGEFMKRERKLLHILVGKRHRRAGNDNALSGWCAANRGKFRLHNLAEWGSGVTRP